jgi:hypothetical protein
MWYSPQVAVIAFLEALPNAHCQPKDHAQVIARLTNVLKVEKKLATSYALHIGGYLTSNLQLNTHVLLALECLCLAHELLPPSVRNAVNEVLMGKYKVGTDYWQQLRRLEAVSSELV